MAAVNSAPPRAPERRAGPAHAIGGRQLHVLRSDHFELELATVHVDTQGVALVLPMVEQQQRVVAQRAASGVTSPRRSSELGAGRDSKTVTEAESLCLRLCCVEQAVCFDRSRIVRA